MADCRLRPQRFAAHHQEIDSPTKTVSFVAEVLISAEEITRRALPIVLPVTRTQRGYATHVEMENALPVTSYVQCELIRAVSADRILRQVGEVHPVDMLRIATIVSRMLNL